MFNPAIPAIITLINGNMKKRKQKKAGEYFAEYDDECGLWCVFHTDLKSGFAYATYTGRKEAEQDAMLRNTRME